MKLSNGFCFFVALTFALISPASGWADSEPENLPSKQSATAPGLKTPDIGGTGTLNYSYDIEVPQFRGLEPRLALTYSSARRTKTGGLYQGWLGYGWGLKGFDVIERARHKGSVPSFSSSDVFLLNGEELIPCSAAVNSTPSCRSDVGGTHTAETENYLRIVANGASSAPTSWTVTNREGTKMLLKPASAFMTGSATSLLATTARYLIASVWDTNGNQIIYDYTCTDTAVCYPLSIRYKNSTSETPNDTDPSAILSVRFTYEDRADNLVAANGQGLSITNKRLAAIRVMAATTVISAYKLTYDSTPRSGTSRLIKVSRYGRGADVTVSGGIVSVSSPGLPPKDTTFAYASYNGFEAPSNISNLRGAGPLVALDVNSDGVTELIQKKDSLRSVLVAEGDVNICEYGVYSRVSGSNFSLASIPGVECNLRNSDDSPSFNLGHFGQDVKDTYVLFRTLGKHVNAVRDQVFNSAKFEKHGNNFTVTVERCDGTVTDTRVKSFCGKSTPVAMTVDFDGNGLDALASTEDDNKQGGLGVVNLYDDGKQQMAFNRNSDLKLRKVPSQSPLSVLQANFVCLGVCKFGDVNGDGLDDLVYTEVGYSMGYGIYVSVYLNVGNSGNSQFVKVVDTKKIAEGDISAIKLVLGSTIISDLDADGRGEVIIEDPRKKEPDQGSAGFELLSEARYSNTARAFRIYQLSKDEAAYTLSAKNVALPNIASSNAIDTTTAEFGDFNGDGLLDVIDRPAAPVSLPNYNDVSGSTDNIINAVDNAP